MKRDAPLERLGPLATAIRELLLHEWAPCRNDRPASSPGIYDDYIPAIHRLAMEPHSGDDAKNIEHIAAYLNFVVKNYVGRIPDKALNRSLADKICTLAEAARQPPDNVPDPAGRIAI